MAERALHQGFHWANCVLSESALTSPCQNYFLRAAVLRPGKCHEPVTLAGDPALLQTLLTKFLVTP